VSALPANLDGAFRLAAGELGFCSASWLFARSLAEEGGDEAVRALRDAVGRSYSVLDAVAAQWLAGARAPSVAAGAEAVARACAGAARVLVAGIEADHLDALVPLLPGARVALLTESIFAADWERILSNYGGRVEATDLSRFQSLAGRSSAIVAFVYGGQGPDRVNVLPSWLRLLGPDVRTQFRSIVGWDVIDRPLEVYPRYLVEAPASDFTSLVRGVA